MFVIVCVRTSPLYFSSYTDFFLPSLSICIHCKRTFWKSNITNLLAMLFGVQGTNFFSLNIGLFFLILDFFPCFLLWCCSKETARHEGVSWEYALLNQMVFTLFQMLFRRFRPFFTTTLIYVRSLCVCARSLDLRILYTLYVHADITVPFTRYTNGTNFNGVKICRLSVCSTTFITVKNWKRLKFIGNNGRKESAK